MTSEKLFLSHATRIKDELIEVIGAEKCPHRVCDLILLNEMMALQVHETIGHPLELDRILGYELSYAGGSHVDLHDFGSLRYGSEKLNVRADGTMRNSPGSVGYDDDGVKAKNVLLIEKGILKSAITSRQMVREANKKAGRIIFKSSGGANRASSYHRLPIERMNNINVDPGDDGTLEQIIASCENGLMVESPVSWSIGSNRENFHFATEIGWEIKEGKIVRVVKNPSYRGKTLEFWNSLAKVGNPETWRLEQVFTCGKGQPNQIMRLGHGVPVCLFKDVEVGH
jgi:TldD protein